MIVLPYFNNFFKLFSIGNVCFNSYLVLAFSGFTDGRTTVDGADEGMWVSDSLESGKIDVLSPKHDPYMEIKERIKITPVLRVGDKTTYSEKFLNRYISFKLFQKHNNNSRKLLIRHNQKTELMTAYLNFLSPQ